MPENVKVLLVDDNPMVLAMLRNALTQMASVTTAANAADALLKAIDDPPDLLVTDLNMPGMDGHELVRKLRARKETHGLPAVIFAPKSDVTERLRASGDEFEEVMEKPFFLRDVTSRMKRLIDRVALEKMARSASGGRTVRGSLEQMGVIDLMQSMEMSRKSCALTLRRGPEQCRMFFVEGQLTHAHYGELRGDEAVYKAVTWPEEGSFEIDFSAASAEQTTTRSTQGLLMEGLRLLDEANR